MDESINKHQVTAGIEAVPNVDLALESPNPNSSYLKIVNNARKAVAIAMVFCGAGFTICFNYNDYLTETLRREPGIWAWGAWAFRIGVLLCLVATLALIIEYLARPAAPKSIRFRSFIIQSMFITITIAGICYSMVISYGLAQGIGATIGTFLLLGALKKDNPARAVLAILAVIVLGPTLLSTQSAYQYARRNADEIIAAGCELMDKYPEKHYIEEADISNQNVPRVLRKLGARSIYIDDERVSIYVAGFPSLTNREFIIYKIPNPTSFRESVFIKRAGNKDGLCKITDKLWMTDY
jgi:hypothetical protein